MSMRDIVGKLRGAWQMPHDNVSMAMWLNWMVEAADEIERLRKENRQFAQGILDHAPMTQTVNGVPEYQYHHISSVNGHDYVTSVQGDPWPHLNIPHKNPWRDTVRTEVENAPETPTPRQQAEGKVFEAIARINRITDARK